MSGRPDTVSKKVREVAPITPQYRELKQVILELLKTLSVSTDPALQYYALRSFLSIAISVLNNDKHYNLIVKCKEVLSQEIELPSVDLRYEMHPNTSREIYTFQVGEKTIKVSSEVFVPTFQMIERFLYYSKLFSSPRLPKHFKSEVFSKQLVRLYVFPTFRCGSRCITCNLCWIYFPLIYL